MSEMKFELPKFEPLLFEYRLVRPAELVNARHEAVRKFVVYGWLTADKAIWLTLREERHHLGVNPNLWTIYFGPISFGVEPGDKFWCEGEGGDAPLLQICEVVSQFSGPLVGQ